MNRPDVVDRVGHALGLDREGAVDLDAVGEMLLGWVFGDRVGLALFLGSMLFFAAYWRVGIFTNDSYAVANALVGLTHGHLSVDTIVFGPRSGVTPGMNVVGGRRYGRDYGLVVAALPLVWLQWGLATVVDLRVAMAGAWCLGLLALAVLVGRQVGRPRQAAAAGSVAAFVLFAASAAVATPLGPRWYPVVALQVVTMTASAFTAVLVYRLLGRLYGRRAGWVAGAAVAVATPVGFWASFPKRHAVTACLVVATLYCLYRSRSAPTDRSAVRFRALAYVPVGLTAWVHAAEGLILLVALVAIDLPTARSNRARDLAVVGAALCLSLVPFFLTNLLIAGNPLLPPRLLTRFRRPDQLGGAPVVGGAGSSAGGSGTAGRATGGSSAGGSHRWRFAVSLTRTAVGLALLALHQVLSLERYLGRSLAAVGDGGRLWHVFVRSGYIPGLPPDNDRAINLSVLEAMPLLAALSAVPVLARASIRTNTGPRTWQRVRRSVDAWRDDPARVVDAFVVVYLALLVLLNLGLLPMQFMLTVRYLHPIYPLGVYCLARVAPVRRAVTEEGARVAAGYGLTVCLGLPLYVGTLAWTNAVESEAVQVFALSALVVAALVAVWSVLGALGAEREWRVGAPLLGVAAGATTVYLLVSGLGFMAYTHDFALPLSRVVATRLLPINPLRSLF